MPQETRNFSESQKLLSPAQRVAERRSQKIVARAAKILSPDITPDEHLRLVKKIDTKGRGRHESGTFGDGNIWAANSTRVKFKQ